MSSFHILSVTVVKTYLLIILYCLVSLYIYNLFKYKYSKYIFLADHLKARRVK